MTLTGKVVAVVVTYVAAQFYKDVSADIVMQLVGRETGNTTDKYTIKKEPGKWTPKVDIEKVAKGGAFA